MELYVQKFRNTRLLIISKHQNGKDNYGRSCTVTEETQITEILSKI